jgi:hypothetical protein
VLFCGCVGLLWLCRVFLGVVLICAVCLVVVWRLLLVKRLGGLGAVCP